MAYPSRPERYPDAFRALFLRAQAGEVCVIPSANPHGLRGKLYAYARALRAADQSELADCIEIKTRPGSIVVANRHTSPEAKEISAALATLPSPEDEPSDSFFGRIAK
jgi:hypothetical protein